MGRETKEVWAMPTCYCLTFKCCQPCLPNFQCFQSCVSWTPFCIFSCYFSYAVVSGTYPWAAVSQAYQKWLPRLAEYDDVIREPLFSLASGPPNPKPTTVCICIKISIAYWQVTVPSQNGIETVDIKINYLHILNVHNPQTVNSSIESNDPTQESYYMWRS